MDSRSSQGMPHIACVPAQKIGADRVRFMMSSLWETSESLPSSAFPGITDFGTQFLSCRAVYTDYICSNPKTEDPINFVLNSSETGGRFIFYLKYCRRA